jgi:hypothetical protein
MKKSIEELRDKMELALRDADASAASVIHKAELSYYALSEIMEQLKTFVLDYEFKNEEEEIMFFKEIKPLFQSEFIYQHKIYKIESKRPIGKKKSILKYYLKKLNRFELFFKKNKKLYVYYNTQKRALTAYTLPGLKLTECPPLFFLWTWI